MTRKDYIAIANAIKATLANTDNADERTGVHKATGAIAQALYEDNSRFDRTRFFNWIDGVKK